MSSDYDVVLTRKDGSVRNFRIYRQPNPKDGDLISLPVDGQMVAHRRAFTGIRDTAICRQGMCG